MLRIFQSGQLRYIGEFLLLTATAAAQMGASTTGCQVTIRVLNDNRTPARQGLELTVRSGSGYTVLLYTDADGVARLRIPAGSYTMNARGGPQEQASEWNFDIAPGESLHTEEFRLKASGRTLSTETTITVAELQLSSSARKELNKGLEKLQRHDLAGASKRFYNVLKKYPGCAAAWNGLGAIAFQTGEPAKAKSDFEKAIEADPQFAPAYLNLGRVLLLAKEYAAGEQLLYKAAGLDPTSVETLSLLAYFQLLRGKLDLAIATANRVHIMQHERYAMVHFIAASAYERQNRQKEAAIQYRQYLQEAPDGLSAERARSALTVLQASAQ